MQLVQIITNAHNHDENGYLPRHPGEDDTASLTVGEIPHGAGLLAPGESVLADQFPHLFQL